MKQERVGRIEISKINLIKDEIQVWANRNFPTTKFEHCILGMHEEIGELCHAVLKEYQGIRKEDFGAAKKDAIGDIAIYFLDYLNRSNLELLEPGSLKNSFYYEEDLIKLIDFLSLQVSSLRGKLLYYLQNEESDPTKVVNTAFIVSLYNLCDLLGYDFLEILQETWNGVKKRDWIIYPKNGLTE